MAGTIADEIDRETSIPDTAAIRCRMFAVGWALAALFHLAGNARPEWIDPSAGFVAVQLAVGAAAVAVLADPRRRQTLIVLCLLVVVSAWMEAPVVGNHWVLAALISLAYLVAEASVRRSRNDPRDQVAQLWMAFAPAARLGVIVAYGFAAFAKLNSDFFDPSVSCAVYYHDQLVQSWGLGFLTSAGRPMVGLVVAATAAMTELSVALGLIAPRTRRWALALALPFHWLLALDWTQHFWDFSAVLFAGFLLFADDGLVEGLHTQWVGLKTSVRPAVRRGVLALGAVSILCVAAATAVPDSRVLRGLAVLTGHVAWVLIGSAVLFLVLAVAVRTPPAGAGAMLRARPVTLLVPLLVLVNGLSPYTEIKTGFGWNMYSNLRTVDGQTNHFLLPSTLDLTGLQSDRAEVLSASDPHLRPLLGTGYEVVFSELLEYADAHPDAAVTYRRGGRVHELRDDAHAARNTSLLSRKLQSFRVVDASGAQRCQAAFTPAR